jgi:hypothetical protein
VVLLTGLDTRQPLSNSALCKVAVFTPELLKWTDTFRATWQSFVLCLGKIQHTICSDQKALKLRN